MFNVDELALVYEQEAELEDMPGAPSDRVLVECLNKLCRVDLNKMSKACGRSAEDLVIDLRGSAIFQDPAAFESEFAWRIDKGWVTKSQYCCGNIHTKLVIAERMNKRFPGLFDANVAALRRMLPDKLSMSEIHISPGAPWVPPKIYADFLKELLRFDKTPEVIYSRQSATWQIIPPDEAKNSVYNNMTYGTAFISAVKIFEQTMNARTVKVYDYVPTTHWTYDRVFNRVATVMAQEKQKEIILEFNRWIRASKERCTLLEERYNNSFVGYGVSTYDGDFLKLDDINPKVNLFPHQRNAVARMLLSPQNLLLAHEVGSGKTHIMCTGMHELYRKKLSHKNLIVVPKGVLKATVKTYKYLYPHDKILAVYPKDFNPKKRMKILEKIRDEDYTAVFMAYSSFDMIVMSKDYWLTKYHRQLEEIKAVSERTPIGPEKRLLEKQRDSLQKKILDTIMDKVDTPWLTFDRLGIETLIVDEAHNYKNIPLQTRADNIVGMHSVGSKKCREMLEKTAQVKKIVFATGTPLTNSLADLFVLQSYLQPEDLKFRGIESFDMWINTFAERETGLEVDIDNNLRTVTRFSTFHNLTELMALFSTVCDFHNVDTEANELPMFAGYTDISVPRSLSQKEYIRQLAERTELIRTHQVSRTEDNLLKVTTDGRLCALDIRLVDSAFILKDKTKNKVEACAEKVYEFYIKYPGTSQIVFSDIGTPKAGFNIYDSLKYELMGLGIPENEIAYIHDATSESARERLFADVNAGRVRVIIGSTQKLGQGVNVQESLVAMHHLSIPWKPSDLVQREGRIIRRGNRCKEVFICRYITEGSFDAYSWQLLENKQRFISSFLSGTSATRDADDVADVVLDYAEVQALAIGNPLIKRRVETANKLERTRISQRQRQRQLNDLMSIVEGAPEEIKRVRERFSVIIADMARYGNNKTSIPQEERLAFGEELLCAIAENHMRYDERMFDTYQGFEVVLPAGMDIDKPHIYIRNPEGGSYRLDMETDKALGCAMRIDHLLDGLKERADGCLAKIKELEKQAEEAKTDIETGNKYDAAVSALEEELEAIDDKLEKENAKSA